MANVGCYFKFSGCVFVALFQTSASLANIRLAACHACYCVDATFVVGCGGVSYFVVRLGKDRDRVAAFEGNSYVSVLEGVGNFSDLW